MKLVLLALVLSACAPTRTIVVEKTLPCITAQPDLRIWDLAQLQDWAAEWWLRCGVKK